MSVDVGSCRTIPVDVKQFHFVLVIFWVVGNISESQDKGEARKTGAFLL
jgi:hypothetical protein